MSKNQRFALLGIAAAIAAIAVIVAVASGGGDDGKGGTTAADTGTKTQSNPDTSTTEPPGSATPINPPQPPDQPDQSNVKLIVVEGGEPEGGVQKLKFKKGDKVEIDVVSDQADEAHLHGYDIEKELKPGETAKFRFTADKEGVFELELHETEAQLAKITVEP